MDTTTTKDLVALLLEDHSQVEGLFSRFGAVNRTEWGGLFCELTHMLVGHEVAEEEVVYPEVRKALEDGKQLADARIAEQSAAEQLLAEMERFTPDDDKFRTSLEKLQTAVLTHARNEEQTVFSRLRTTVPADQLARLGQRYEKAKASAPTHPHPHAPDTPPGNVVMGPVAALFDRMRDAVRSNC